jgi:putative membrane protein
MHHTLILKTTLKTATFIAASIIGSGVLIAQGSQAPSPNPPATAPRAVPPGQGDAKTGDHSFVTEAAMGGMAEVDLGRLASTQAANDKVKAFGQRMVTDHGKAGNELKSLAASKQITLPTAIDAKHQATHDKFAKLSGAEFDRAYVKDMLADHKKDVDAFARESMSGQDSDVKAWAAKTLPTLREHLRMIEDLDKELNSTRSTR